MTTLHIMPAIPLNIPKPVIIQLKLSIRVSCAIKLLIPLFVPAGNKPAEDGEIETDKNIKGKVGEIEYASICKTALLEENEWKARAGNIVSAGICSQ